MTPAPTPETMRERMARAIYERDHPEHLRELPWKRQDDEYRDVYRGFVDAILDVLAEPSAGMRHAGMLERVEQSKRRADPLSLGEQAAGCWRAMVAAVRSGA